MGLFKDCFRVKRPYDGLVDELISNNFIRLDRKTNWTEWNYLAKVRNATGKDLWTFQMPYGTRQVFIIKKPGELERVETNQNYTWFRMKK